MARPWEFRQVGSWEDQAMVNELLQNFSEPERKGFMISGRVVGWGIAVKNNTQRFEKVIPG